MEQQKKGVPVWVWFLVVLIPVALVAIGVLSALAIYGVSKYMKSAKTAEAQATLTIWAAGLARCGEKEGRLPASTTPVPASLSDVRGKKYQSSAGEWAEPAHTCAGFSVTGPQYFQYRWQQQSDEAGSLHALADLNGDATVDVEVQVDVSCAAGTCAAGAAVTRGNDGSASGASPSAEPVSAPTSRSSGPELTRGQIAVLLLGVVCLLGSVGAGFWLVVLAFQESVTWGLLSLFVPCSQWVFVFQFWARAKRPFLLQLGSFTAFIVSQIVLALLGGFDGSIAAAAAPVTASASSADFPAGRPPHVGPGVRLPPPPPVVVVPELTGAPADLSTVMGKARKLANQWDQDAALLGIEALLVSGVVPTADGGKAKLTFGPSPYHSVARKSGVFIVTYDQGGLAGAPAKTPAGKALPEPMCAPEAVYSKIAAGESPAITLRYGFDAAGRPAWMVSSGTAGALRLFEPQRCDAMAVVTGQRAL